MMFAKSGPFNKKRLSYWQWFGELQTDTLHYKFHWGFHQGNNIAKWWNDWNLLPTFIYRSEWSPNAFTHIGRMFLRLYTLREQCSSSYFIQFLTTHIQWQNSLCKKQGTEISHWRSCHNNCQNHASQNNNTAIIITLASPWSLWGVGNNNAMPAFEKERDKGCIINHSALGDWSHF